MARRIRIPNPDLSREEKTYLDADYSSGTALTVISNLGFADNYMVVVGEPGEDKTEAKDATGITGNTQIDISGALKFSHNKATPVYKSVWESASIERRSGSAGAWSVISVSELDWDKPETIYIDSTGSDDHHYRFRFYNQFLALYSEYSPTITGAGFSRSQVGYMIQKVRRKIKDPNRKKVKDKEIIDLLQEAVDVIKAIRPNWWFWKVDTFKADNGIATVANQYRYSLATYTDLGYLERIRFNYNDGTDNYVYDLLPLDEIEFDRWVRDQDRTADDWVYRFKLVPADSDSAQGYIEVEPTPENSDYGTFYPEYWKDGETLDDVADETAIPIPQVLEDYAIWQIYEDLGVEVKAAIYKKKFYGPSPADKDKESLTGIALLEQMNKSQGVAVGLPKQLWRWRGRKALRDLFAEKTLDRDVSAERYF